MLPGPSVCGKASSSRPFPANWCLNSLPRYACPLVRNRISPPFVRMAPPGNDLATKRPDQQVARRHQHEPRQATQVRHHCLPAGTHICHLSNGCHSGVNGLEHRTGPQNGGLFPVLPVPESDQLRHLRIRRTQGPTVPSSLSLLLGTKAHSPLVG